MKKVTFLLLTLFVLTACGTIPGGPQFSEISVPVPSAEKALIIVYRDYAEPTALDATLLIGGKEVFALSQKSFAFAEIEPGDHTLEIKWPAVSMTPGWQGNDVFEVDKTYYYQLVGSSGGGFFFKSKLSAQSEQLASASLFLCCRLITKLKNQVTLATKVSANKNPKGDFTGVFEKLKVGMSPEDVIQLAGKPDRMNLESTGKNLIPFYFGTDTLRSYWSYTGVGFVVFTRNEYTGSLKLLETKHDTKAP